MLELARTSLLAFALLIVRDAMADESVSKEYQVKAAFLYNFTKFIEWPAQSFQRPDEPIVIGVYCTGPVAAELEKIVRDRKVRGRALSVRHLEATKDARNVHLLFVCKDRDVLFAAIDEEIQANPVVTVGETEQFARRGGVIGFVLKDDKVRFEIDTRAADQAGVKISAQLQKLATVVHQAP